MARDEEGFSIDNVVCTRQSEKAILCSIGKKSIWVPQSQVHDDSEVYASGHKGKLVVTSWFAEKNDLEKLL